MAPNTGVTFTGPGRGNVINTDPLHFDVITISDPDPYDLSDTGGFNAAMTAGCSCDQIVNELPPLQVCSHPYLYWSYLFRRKELQQLSPISLDGSACRKLPIGSLKNGVRFHVFEDAILDRQLKMSKDDPFGTHDRVGTRIGSSSSSGYFSQSLYQRGWEAIYGDQPGYRKGREITFDSGKVKKGILPTNVYKKLTLTVQTATDANGEKYTILQGMQGYYIRDITIYYDVVTDNEPDRRFHMIFRYDVATDSGCTTDAYRKRKIIEQEDVIDNIGIQPSTLQPSQNSSPVASPAEVLAGTDGSGNYVEVDTRYSTADFIELRGYQLRINQVVAYCLQPSDYFANVLTADSFAASFDDRGRLFVFYEDEMNYTKLPYIGYTCLPSSSSSSSSTVTTPSIDGGGGGGGEGVGTEGGGGGGGGGSGQVGGGIPGFPPGGVSYNNSSSSSGASSSSSSSGTGVGSSSSSADTTPPPPIRNPAGSTNRDDNDEGFVHLTWDIPPGTTITGQPLSSSSGDTLLDEVTFCIDHAVGDIEGTYNNVVCGLTTTQYDHYVCGTSQSATDCAVEGEWNYYKIYAVDKAGNKSPYLIVQLFLILPRACSGRDCLGCETQGFKSRNSYTVYFSKPSALQLAFECTACDGASQTTNPPFIRILDDAFFEKQLSQLTIGSNTSSGNKVPVMFCLPQACDADVQNECKWENTFYVPALTNACDGFGCVQGFDKVLVPMTVTLTQTASGWSLEVTAMGPDCKKLPIFKTTNAGIGCKPPERFISELTIGQIGTPSASDEAAHTDNPCALFPPNVFFKHTGTISVAMSPDLGQTWYQFPGVIQINKDKMAVRPVVTLDQRSNTFHLFYVERDYIDDNSQLLIQGFSSGETGFDARVLHVALRADHFKEIDAFIPFYPAPDDTVLSSSTATGPIFRPTSGFYAPLLKQFSTEGQLIRLATQSQVIYEEHIGAANAPGSKTISITDENNSAYIDNQGRIHYVRFKQSGTLIDPPDRLTRRRRRATKCGTFTWTVSADLPTNADGTPKDCACQTMLGSFRLELDRKTANYIDSKWTLSVDDTYNDWVVTADNGMLTFKKKRNLTQCPPTGPYTVTCNRCGGNVFGTLSAERVRIQGRDAGDIDNGNFPAKTSSLTDFGSLPLRTSREHEFVIWNNRPSELGITGTPLISIGGADASDFVLTQSVPATIQPYDFAIFAIKFSPSSAGDKLAGVTIVNDSTDENPYIFNLKGKGISQSGSSSSSVIVASEEPTGVVFSADAVGTIYTSNDEGGIWSSSTMDIKTGQHATCTYDEREDALHVFYVTDDMMFARRYPSILYTKTDDGSSGLDQAFDGFNIVDPPQVILPDINAFVSDAIGLATGGGLGGTVTALGNLALALSLPNVKTPGDVIDTFEEDLLSKKTKLINEKDPGGLPIFLVGNREGALINGYYPYPPQYVFNDTTSVAQAKPAAYITPQGSLRFFYVDLNGNVNGGTIAAESPTIDIKRKVNNG